MITRAYTPEQRTTIDKLEKRISKIALRIGLQYPCFGDTLDATEALSTLMGVWLLNLKKRDDAPSYVITAYATLVRVYPHHSLSRHYPRVIELLRAIDASWRLLRA